MDRRYRPRGDGWPKSERPAERPRPSEPPKPTEAWEQDPQFEARARRMLEQAERLGCKDAGAVMLAMVQAMDKFGRMENIYLGPTAKEFADLRRALRRQGMEEETEERAWEKTHYIYAQFDLIDPRSGSDWARVIGVFKASLIPGEGIAGVLDITAPPEGVRGDERWQRFEVWCEKRRINARTIWQVGQQIRKDLDVYPADREALQQKLNALTMIQLDQIISAGYHSLEDLRVSGAWAEPGYKPLEGLIRDLDPQRKQQDADAAWAAAEKARNEFMAPHAIPPRVERGKWIPTSYRARNDWDSLWREARDVFDHAYETELAKLHTPAPNVEIACQSAALRNRPVAMIVARRSRVGDRNFAQGIHPVSPEIIKALAGPEAVHADKPRLAFDARTGQVFRVEDFRLVQDQGPLLEKRLTPDKSAEGVAIFVHQLVGERSHDLWDALPFVFKNEQLVKEDADQIYDRSRGVLSARGFDLEAWYCTRLAEQGNITSVDEAKIHTEELTLKLADVYPGQEQLLAQLDKEYPTSITLGACDYHIEYRYSPAQDGRGIEVANSEQFEASIELQDSKSKELFLSLPSTTRVEVGSTEEPIPVRFIVSTGRFSREEASDVETAQELIDARRLYEEWDKYSDKNKRWWIPMRVQDSFPVARDLVTEPLQPYTTAKNGEPKLPVLAVASVGPKDIKEEGEYGVSIALYPTRSPAEEAEVRSRQLHAQHQKRAEQIRAADPELMRGATELRDVLYKNLEAIDWKTNIYARGIYRDMYGAVRQASRFLKNGELDEALPLLQTVEMRLRECEQLWRLFMEGKGLLAELEKRGIWYTHNLSQWRKIFNDKSYTVEDHSKSLPAIEVLTRAIEEMKLALQQ